jgi:hypothetical protein
VEIDWERQERGLLMTLVDYEQLEFPCKNDSVEDHPKKMLIDTPITNKRGPYRKYNAEQVQRLIVLVTFAFFFLCYYLLTAKIILYCG